MFVFRQDRNYKLHTRMVKEPHLLLDVSKHLKFNLSKANSWTAPSNLALFKYSLSQWKYFVHSKNLTDTPEMLPPRSHVQSITQTYRHQFYSEIALSTFKVLFYCCWQWSVSLAVTLLKYISSLWMILRSSVCLWCSDDSVRWVQM